MTDTELAETVHLAETILKNTYRRVNERRIAEALVQVAKERDLLRDRLEVKQWMNGGAK